MSLAHFLRQRLVIDVVFAVDLVPFFPVDYRVHDVDIIVVVVVLRSLLRVLGPLGFAGIHFVVVRVSSANGPSVRHGGAFSRARLQTAD